MRWSNDYNAHHIIIICLPKFQHNGLFSSPLYIAMSHNNRHVSTGKCGHTAPSHIYSPVVAAHLKPDRACHVAILRSKPDITGRLHSSQVILITATDNNWLHPLPQRLLRVSCHHKSLARTTNGASLTACAPFSPSADCGFTCVQNVLENIRCVGAPWFGWSPAVPRSDFSCWLPFQRN